MRRVIGYADGPRVRPVHVPLPASPEECGVSLAEDHFAVVRGAKELQPWFKRWVPPDSPLLREAADLRAALAADGPAAAALGEAVAAVVRRVYPAAAAPTLHWKLGNVIARTGAGGCLPLLRVAG